MKMVSRLLLLTAALADLVPAVAARHRSEAPASKALELLEKLWSQGQAELNDEALRFEKLKQWCADTAASKKSEIQDGEEKEERTSAVVESTEAAVAAVQEDIEDLVAKASKLDEKRSHTEKRRQDESTTYITSDEELQKSIRAVQRASFLLREKNDAESKAAAASELQTAPRDTALAALQVEDPGFAASSILEMLMKLSERFHAELEDLRKAETQAKQEHELLLNQLEMEHEGMEAALRTKRSALGDAQRAQTEAGEDLEDARKDLQQDKKYLEDLHVMCSLKAESFKKRRSSRQAELEALKAAVGLIRDKVSGLVQLRRGSSLVALRGEVRRAFQALRSGGLEALATRLAGKPLAKVRQMIMETINNLEEASREEGEKQAFCSKELAASRAAQTAAKDAAAELRGELEEAAAEVQQLTEDEAALRLDVEKLGRAAEEAQKERTESKTRNDASIKEAEESQQALEKAMVMLREVYGKAPASLLQVDQTSTSSDMPAIEGAPETFPDADYVAAPQRGLLELLEVAASSYASAAAELAEEEKADEGQIQQFLAETRKDKEIKSRELAHKQDRRERKQMFLKQGEAALATSSDKLAKITEYLEKLQSQCKAPVVPPEERRQKRAEEMTALQEALAALEEVSE